MNLWDVLIENEKSRCTLVQAARHGKRKSLIENEKSRCTFVKLKQCHFSRVCFWEDDSDLDRLLARIGSPKSQYFWLGTGPKSQYFWLGTGPSHNFCDSGLFQNPNSVRYRVRAMPHVLWWWMSCFDIISSPWGWLSSSLLHRLLKKVGLCVLTLFVEILMSVKAKWKTSFDPKSSIERLHFPNFD